MPASVRNLQRRVRLSPARLGATARAALGALGRPEAQVDVTVVDDPAIRRLNARYLGVGAPTDVLAFHLEGPGPLPLLGEVILSADRAVRQAARLRVPVGLELELLVVHGILHLAGYDDADPAEARLMHERARQILSARRGGAARRLPPRLWRGLLPAP